MNTIFNFSCARDKVYGLTYDDCDAYGNYKTLKVDFQHIQTKLSIATRLFWEGG